MRGNTAGRVGCAAPAGSDNLIVGVGRVVGFQAGQLNGTDGAAVVHRWDADQRDVVQQSPAVPARVDDDVILVDGVLNLGARAHSAAQVNGDGINTA